MENTKSNTDKKALIKINNIKDNQKLNNIDKNLLRTILTRLSHTPGGFIRISYQELKSTVAFECKNYTEEQLDSTIKKSLQGISEMVYIEDTERYRKRYPIFARVYHSKETPFWAIKLNPELQKHMGIFVSANISTGYPLLDKAIGKLQKGRVYVLASRPSVGKTTFAMNIVTNIFTTQPQTGIAFFDMEFAPHDVARRLIGCAARVNSNKIAENSLDPTEKENVIKAAHELEKSGVYIEPDGHMDFWHIQNTCQKLFREKKLDLIVMDYIQLIAYADNTTKAINDPTFAKEITDKLHQLAIEFNVPVLVVSALPYTHETLKQMPNIEDLREEALTPEGIDTIMILHDPDVYKRDDDIMKSHQYPLELFVKLKYSERPQILHFTLNPKYQTITQNENDN